MRTADLRAGGITQRSRWGVAAGLLLVALICHQSAAGPLEDRLSVELGAGYGVAAGGWTRIRQYDVQGDRLDLADDLGMESWFRIRFEAAWRFDDTHGLRAGVSGNLFRGVASLDRDVTHEGAVYPAGTRLEMDRTDWWRVEAWYLFTPWDSEYVSFSLLGGVVTDLLDLWVVPDPRPPNQPRDDHENFATAWVPLPAAGVRCEVRPAAGLRAAMEVHGTWIEGLSTWHTSGGRVEHSQWNFDVQAEIGYRVAELEFGATARYQVFHIEQNNREDGNGFRLWGVSTGLFVRLRL